MQFFYRAVIYCFTLLCLYTPAQAQDSAFHQPGRPANFMQFVRDFGKKEAASSVEKFRNGRIGIRQERLLHDLRQTSERARIFLRKGLDTARLKADINLAQQQLTLLREGIFHGAPQHAARHLTVTASVLDELLQQVTEKREALELRLHAMIGFVDRIDSLSADSSLYTFPFDSLHTARYIQKMAVVAKDLGPADTALRRSVAALQHLQTEADLMVFNIRSTREDAEQLRMAQVARTFEQEYPFLWQPASPDLPPGKILALSYAKEKLAWTYYVRDAGGRLLVLLLLTLGAWYFLRSLKTKWEEEGTTGPEQPGRLVLRYPLLSAVVIVPSIFQFIFLQPPYIFSCGLWLTGAICLAFIFHGYITRFWMWFWIIALVFFVLSSATNMILPASRQERWWMLLLSAASLVYSAYVLQPRRRAQVREKRILYFISFLVVMEAGALLFNVLGRYNLAKTMFVTGFAGLVIAILFLWTIRLINEGLSAIALLYKHPERKFFYLNFERIGEKAPGFFYVFLVAGWFVLIGRNFYALQEAVAPLSEFLNTERTLGSYTFTINSLFIFVLVIIISALLSQIVSFFAGEPGDQQAKDKQARRPGIGSWLLLIRIFVLALGLFLAFAAAGIPLDKMAIALGALGIGIGLGLQGLVSNLVSGLIIAFEKPVNVGDIIEVNGMRGTMKTIGFRSSVVALIDGPCLVIPNGDLLSNHLVNWTMGHNRKRVNVVIGVAYGSHLKKVQEILEAVLHNNERVLHVPAPIVSVKAFEDSSIDFDIYFWVGHVREYLPIRGEVMADIEEAFRLEGINVPFPQRDVHIITRKNDGGND